MLKYSLLFLLGMMPFSLFAAPASMGGTGERFIVVDPVRHYWAAYNEAGNLVRSGLASAGADWCHDMKSPCHTDTGTFRILSLGGRGCKSPSFPLPKGGAPMPYCMYFTRYQALHGSNHVVSGNISHGCVRMNVSDAAWLRYHFATIGTLVIIKNY